MKIKYLIITLAFLFSGFANAEKTEKQVNEKILKLVPENNKYIYKKIEDEKFYYIFTDPLIPNDANMYAFFMHAIPEIFSDETSFVGEKLFLSKIKTNTNAISLKGKNHTYFALPVRISDTDRRIGRILFWRE